MEIYIKKKNKKTIDIIVRDKKYSRSTIARLSNSQYKDTNVLILILNDIFENISCHPQGSSYSTKYN